MAQSDLPNGGGYTSVPAGARPKISDGLLGHQLPRAAVAEFVLSAPRGSVIALGGIDGESLRDLLDQVEPAQHGRIALFARIVPELTTEAIVEQVIDLLAETARRLWPVWFTNVNFSGCRNDTLGRLAVGAIARGAAEEIHDLSPSWTEEAARLVLDNCPPRVSGISAPVELSQLALPSAAPASFWWPT